MWYILRNATYKLKIQTKPKKWAEKQKKVKKNKKNLQKKRKKQKKNKKCKWNEK